MRSSEPLFRVPPFPAFPSLSRYVAVGSIHEAMTRVCRSIDAREGISLVIGPPGTGKSLLANLIDEAYRDAREVVLLGEAPLSDPAAFGRHLLHRLGIHRTAATGHDWQLTLADHLTGAESSDAGLLILVDEAQSLSSEVLEAIRMTTNIMRRGEPRVSAVLCGGPRLDETLADPALEPLTQRVATRCYLHPLNLDESRRYITEAIRSCGADPDETIREEAVAAVHHACSGVPRLINQLMTQAIDCAEASNQSVIDEGVVDRAWAQLQQLPSPMIEEPALAERGAAVEFGTLDDSPEPHDSPEPRDACEIATEAAADSPAAAAPTPAAEPLFEPASEPASEPLFEAASEREQLHQPPTSVAELDCAVSLPSVLFPEELFGQFDEEEEVIVGAGVPPQSGSREPVAAPVEPIESTLHQQIVGIASQAAEAVGASTVEGTQRPQDDTRLDEATEPHPGEAARPIDPAPTAEQCEADAEPDSRPAAAAAQPVIWLTETEDGGLVRDDRDLLVIEDEVELQRASEPAASVEEEEEEAPVAVDFQAMLERMRSGS